MKNLIRRILRKFDIDLIKLDKNVNTEIKFSADIDLEAREIINQVENYTMTSVERLFSLINATRYISQNNILGDFVECGVWKGGSMMATAYSLKNMGELDRNLYLFDTFEGMTPPSNNDITYSNLEASKLLAESSKEDSSSIWCYSPLDEVKINITSTGYNPEKIHLIKGKVEETIPQCIPEKIALLRLDTDWYESTRHELEHLFPRLVHGGVIIIDDYGHWKGCQQATDEYFQKNNIPILLNRIDYTGRIAIKL
jgi:O-methyltransferase